MDCIASTKLLHQVDYNSTLGAAESGTFPFVPPMEKLKTNQIHPSTPKKKNFYTE